jgi:hypothetical protein
VKVSHKVVFSLIITLLIFAGFTVLTYTSLFDLIESRFYNPAVTRAAAKEAALDTEAVGTFLSELQEQFTGSLALPAIQRSFLPNQTPEDIFERSRVYGLLLETRTGLQSIRIIDAGGRWIHYSTLDQDILRQDIDSVTYRNYDAGPGNIPYELLAAPNGEQPRIILDEAGAQIIFAHPFYDSFGMYRGTALFSLSSRAMKEHLVGEGRVTLRENIVMIGQPPGIVLGLPPANRELLISRIAPVLKTAEASNSNTVGNSVTVGHSSAAVTMPGRVSFTPLELDNSDTTLILLASQTGQGIFIGRLVNETLFLFPNAMKFILLAAFFITVYLTIFLFFNIRQDPMTIVRARIRKLQVILIEEYQNRLTEGLRTRGSSDNGAEDWHRWGRELEQRREDARLELKCHIGGRLSKKLEQNIDAYIDTAWAELAAIIGSHAEFFAAPERTEAEKNADPLSQTSTGHVHPPAGRESLPSPGIAGGKDESYEDLEELEEIGEDDTAEFLPAEDQNPEIPEEVLENIKFDTDLIDTGSLPVPGAAGLEILTPDYGMFLVYPSLFAAEPDGEPPELVSASATEEDVLTGEIPDEDAVIEYRDGINYISKTAFAPGTETEKSLDTGFKELIDSVLRNNQPM